MGRIELTGLTVIAGRPGMGAEAVARKLIAESGLAEGEYLLVDLSDGGRHIITLEEAKKFQALQIKKGIPVILISNLSRRTEKDVESPVAYGEAVPVSTIPRKTDIPSGVYDVADHVFMVYRESYYRVSYGDAKDDIILLT